MTTRYKCVHGNTLDEDCPECGDQRAEAMTEDEKIFHHDWPGPSKTLDELDREALRKGPTILRDMPTVEVTPRTRGPADVRRLIVGEALKEAIKGRDALLRSVEWLEDRDMDLKQWDELICLSDSFVDLLEREQERLSNP